MKNDKEKYYKTLNEYEKLVREEKMEYLKREILNFYSEGSILFGNSKNI